MRLKRKMLGIILSLVLVLGLMPGMSLTASAEDPYANLKNTTTTIKFDNKDWYLIDYNSDTVTLLSKECVGASIFNTEGSGNAYSGSTLENYVKEWYVKNFSSDAKSVVSQSDIFIITHEQANAIHNVNADVWECPKDSGADANKWWLSSPGYVDNQAMCIASDFDWSIMSQSVSSIFGVRPALKLNLSYVNFASQTNTFTVASKANVTGVSLNKNTVTLDANSTESLTATVVPNNAADKDVTWSSDNTSVATVDANGKVIAVAAGTATITVTATNGTNDTSDDKTATCEVKVNEASSGGGSSDSGSGSSSSSGSSDSGNTSGGTSSGSSDTPTTDTSANVPYNDVAISTGYVKDITGTVEATAESNPFETKIENNDNLTTLLSLTDAEVVQGVNVWLDIQNMSTTVPQADKDIVQNASANYTVGMYLDINLFKKVGENAATKITETNGTVKASILIPESLWKDGRTFEIIRVHDGVATAITGTYDESTHVFTFETDKFSTYALAYKDSASSNDSGTNSDSGSSNSSNSTQPTAPKTGDPNDIRVWYLLLLASSGGLGFLRFSKKKKVNY